MNWIRAIDLDRWADTIGSRTALSALVSGLIRGSAHDTSFRFPTGDSAQAPGYDGRLVAKGVPPYLPDGESVWEFGVEKDYLTKANRDLKTRSNNPGAATPGETTFIFVTPRHWKRSEPSLEEWQKEKTKQGPWKEVRVIDGVALEDWFDRNPAVAANAAREILATIPANGARSTGEFWDEYTSRFKPPLNERVLLCDREEQAKLLLNQLGGNPGAYLWQADSEDEAVAFVVAAIRSTDPDARKFLESRTLILDAEEAARQLATRPNMIFIARAPASGQIGQLANRNPTVVPISRATITSKDLNQLARPTCHALAEALATTGLTQDSARRHAASCGRSITILARQIPSGYAQEPEWHSDRNLVPALLVGGWDASSESDQEVVRSVAGAPTYQVYEDSLRRYLRMQDAPILHEGEVWKVREPVDTLARLGYLVGKGDLDRFQRAIENVLSERDPSLNVPEKERPFIQLRGRGRKHSEWVRDGLATTLLLVATFHDEARLDVPMGAQNFVNRLVEGLPGLREDWQVLAGLGRELPLLAEAAPSALLSVVENLCRGDGSAIRPIFRDTDGGLLSSSPHTELLWALEIMAWDPAHLVRASLALAALARIDPGGKLCNRPIGSLAEIFLPWQPQTNATLAQRLVALDQVIAREPGIGWKLVLSLLPTYYGVAMPTSQPRWREAGVGDKELLTHKLVGEGFNQIIQRSLDLAGRDPQRWVALIEAVPNFGPAYFGIACDRLQEFVAGADADQRALLWSAVRNLVNKHKAFPDAKWVMSGPDLKRVESIEDSLKPSDPIGRIAWLFESPYPALPDTDPSGRMEAVDKRREVAVRELYQGSGTGAILSLANNVDYPGYLAAALRTIIVGADEYDRLIDATVGKNDKLNHFAAVLSMEAERKFGEEWRQRVLAWRRDGRYSPEDLVILVLLWEDEPKNWEFVGSMGPEIESSYWKRKTAWPLRGDASSITFALRKYLSVGRAIHALSALGQRADDVPSEIIFELLDKALDEYASPSLNPSSTDLYVLGTIFESLRRRAGVPAVEVARREYAYLPLLYHAEGSLTLHRLMAETPGFFVEVLCDAFRPATGEATEPTEERRARARASYRLLSTFKLVPGQQGSAIDAGVVRAWVLGVRQHAAEADRTKIADEFVGRVLAHAPSDADGDWPHEVIRDIIEEIESEDVERGIQVERHNMRGVFHKAMYEGGKQERALADQAATWAKAAEKWPRTYAMLREIAWEWEEHGKREDIRARHDEMRFE